MSFSQLLNFQLGWTPTQVVGLADVLADKGDGNLVVSTVWMYLEKSPTQTSLLA